MFLLDTCAFLWLASDQSRIAPGVLAQIRDPNVTVYLSAISALEIGTKHYKNKLVLPLEPEAWISLALANHRVTPLAMTWELAVRSSALPRLHADPADRIIVATALHHNLVIVTPDPLIAAYPGVRVLW